MVMKSRFGLDRNIQICKKCLMTNQKPYSLNETKNNKNSKKRDLILMKRVFVMHVYIMKQKEKNRLD